MAAHLQAPIEFLPFIQAGSLRLFDARAEADAQRRARLLGVDPLVALPEALRQAADLIKREGWAITPQLLLCPTSVTSSTWPRRSLGVLVAKTALYWQLPDGFRSRFD